MAQQDIPLYPLRLEPIYKQKVWGGRALQDLGRTLPGGPEARIGESWELADLAESSTSGGGGGQERSLIANGPWAGTSLHELIQRYGPRLLGRLALTAQGGFPLLAKYLDARENLSVQVHCTEAYAQTHSDACVKHEAWYVVKAQPGAVIYKGLRPGLDPARMALTLRGGDKEKIEALLQAVPVKAGDCHYLPSGICHALGAGVMVAEVQTPSDTTFRLYDWGRPGRELHLDEALQCVEMGPPDTRRAEKRSHVAGMFTTVTRLVTCEDFRLEKVRMVESYEQELPYDQPALWMVLEGSGRLESGNGAQPVAFERGQTLLLPANLEQARAIFDADTTWLEVTFPRALPRELA